MALKITANTWFSRNYLVLKPDGIKFYENGMLLGARRFRFADIRCVLLAPNHTLSFQVANEVFSIPTRPDKPRHRAAIDALLAGLESSRLRPGSAVRYPS